MSTTTVRVDACDRCGLEVRNKPDTDGVRGMPEGWLVVAHPAQRWNTATASPRNVDLCAACVESLRHWFSTPSVKPSDF